MDYNNLLKRAMSKASKASAEDRFKIPPADVVISGKQTTVRNFGEIARAIRRDPKHMAKFIFRELAIPGSFDESRLLLQRNFDRESIDKAIKLYCSEFLYCRECGKADTNLAKKGEIMFLKCEACGAERSVKKI
jgi:translation initiation factor 2 subunit 2